MVRLHPRLEYNRNATRQRPVHGPSPDERGPALKANGLSARPAPCHVSGPQGQQIDSAANTGSTVPLKSSSERRICVFTCSFGIIVFLPKQISSSWNQVGMEKLISKEVLTRFMSEKFNYKRSHCHLQIRVLLFLWYYLITDSIKNNF